MLLMEGTPASQCNLDCVRGIVMRCTGRTTYPQKTDPWTIRVPSLYFLEPDNLMMHLMVPVLVATLLLHFLIVKLNEGWPESVKEHGFLLLVLGHYITIQYMKIVLWADERGSIKTIYYKYKTIVSIVRIVSFVKFLTDRTFYTQMLLHTDAFAHITVYSQTFLHADASTNTQTSTLYTGTLRFYTQTCLHANNFTRRCFYTHSFLRTEFLPTDILDSTHSSFYAQTFLHTDFFTHRSVYTQTVLQTEAPLHTDVFTHTLLHTDIFTHKVFADRRFYTQKRKGCTGHFKFAILPLFDVRTSCRAKGFFYTQRFLHTNAFTHRRFHTRTFLHTEVFTHRRFSTNTLSHTKVVTHKIFDTQTPLRTDAFTHRSERVAPDTSNSQFYHRFRRSNLISCEKVAPDPWSRNFTSAFGDRRVATGREKSQFYFGLWRPNIISCERVRRTVCKSQF